MRQLLLLCAALALCPLASLVIGDASAAPIQRGRALPAAEASLGLRFEPSLHGWTARQPLLMELAGLFYIFAHIAVAAWALIWTWWLRRDRFALVRDVFLVTQLLTVAFYVALPTAPPRLVPGAGVSDTLAGLWGREVADSAHLLQSPYAAMPSGHVAFALVAGATFAAIGDRRWLRAFGWAHPPAMAAVTMITGHHLRLDAAGAVAVVTAAGGLVLATRALGRRARAGRGAGRVPAPRSAWAQASPG